MEKIIWNLTCMILIKKFTIKENKLHAKLDKLNNDVKKLNKYTKNNNEKINTKKIRCC